MNDDVTVSKMSDPQTGSTTYAFMGPKNKVGRRVIDLFIEKPIASHGTHVSNVLHSVDDRCTVVVQVMR